MRVHVTWKSTPLTGADTYRADVQCPHTGPGRKNLRAYVAQTSRVNGWPVQELLKKLGLSIRSCCAEDKDDPLARFEWWSSVDDSIRELRTDAQAYPYLQEAVDALPRVLLALASRVDPPGPDDTDIWNAWVRILQAEGPLRGCPADRREAHRERLRRVLRELRLQTDHMTRARALEILSLPADWTPKDLKGAHRREAFTHHPDRGGNPELFKQAQEAYDFLLELRAR